MMRLGVTCLVVLALGSATARADRRAVRDKMVGTWDVGRVATLGLSAHGIDGLRASVAFSETPRGGPKRVAGIASWIETTGEFEIACRPLSQHGSFCRVRPDPGGGLRVRVYAKGHGTGNRGRLVEDVLATRLPR